MPKKPRVIEVFSDDEIGEQERADLRYWRENDPKTYRERESRLDFEKKWDGDDYSEESFP